MTQPGGDVLEALRVVISADTGGLRAGLTDAVQDSRRVGQQAGDQFGEGFTRDANGKLRDGRGRFVKTGQELGQGLADGLRQSSPALDSAMTGLTAKLGGPSTGLGGAFGRLTAGAGGLTAGLTGIVGVAGPAGAAIAGIGAAATAVIVPLNNAVNTFADFEKRLAGVSTLTDQMPSQMGATGRALLNMSTELGMSYRDLAAGLQDVLGAGVRGTEDMGQALLFTKEASKLAIAGQTETAVSTDVLTSVMNAYKMEASQTKKVSDELFAAVRDGKMSFNELAGSLGMVTAIAADASVPLQTVLAALATMTANGVQASSSVDYLRSMISAIINPSEKAASTAKSLGIEFNAQALQSKGLVGVLRDVMTATNGNKDQMGDLLGGVEAVTAATSIASGNFERMEKNLKNQATAAGTTETAYQKMAGTLQKENDKVSANWDKLMVNLGSAFAPFKTEVLQGINDMLTGINKVLERWNVARNVTRSQENVGALEEELKSARASVALGRKIISGESPANDRLRKLWEDTRMPIALQKVADLERRIAEAKQAQVQAEKELVQYGITTSTARLPAGVQGPNFGGVGTPVDPSTLNAESGKFGFAFLSRLKDVFVNDPQASSDCATIAHAILTELGIQIKKSPIARDLMQNAVKAGFQNVTPQTLADLRAGDLITYQGPGYGARLYDPKTGRYLGNQGDAGTQGGVGYHSAVFAGYDSKNRPTVIENPGSGDTRLRVLTEQELRNMIVLRSSQSAFDINGNIKSPTLAPPLNPGGGSKDGGPVTAAQIIKAQQLTAALEAAQAALKKDPGSVPLTKAVITATRELEAFKKASTGNAEALAAIQKEGAKTSGTYIATAADLRKWGNDALRLYKDLEAARESGNTQATAAAERNIATWQGESKARKAVFDAEAAAYKIRQGNAEEAERDADKAAKEQERIQKEAARRAAQLAEQARQGRIQDARLSLTELTGARDQELKLVEGNAAKRLEVERRYAETIRKAKKAIADAEYADAKRDAENRGDRNTANDIARAGRVRDQAYAEADRDATNRVNTAIKGERDAVRNLREEYSRLADGVREKVAAGTFDTAAQQEALKAFNALGAKAKEAGLYTNEHAVAARRSAYALIDQGMATADLIRQSSERIQQIKDENALLDAEAEDARTTIPQLTGMLSELVAQGLDPRKSGFVQLLEEIIKTGGKAGEAAAYVLDNLTQLEADLGGDSPAAIQFRGRQAMERARAAMDPELPDPDGTTLEESTANQLTGQLLDRVFRQPQTIGGRLIAATGAILTDAFTDMGEAGRTAFWEEFSSLVDDPEVGDIGPQLARVLLRRLTDAPEFDALRQKLTGILDGESSGNLTRAQDAVKEADTLAESDPDGALSALEGTLTDLWAAAGRGEDAADAINLVTDAINRLTEAREKGEKAALDDLLTGGNTEAANGAMKAADALAGDGQYAEALSVLEDTLTDLYAAAEEGEDAADAINTVIDAINRLTKARDDAKTKDETKRALEVAEAQDKVAASARELAAAMGEQQAPYADQIRTLDKLKKDFPELGKEIDALIEKWEGLQAQTAKLNDFMKYAGYVRDLAGAFGKLATAADPKKDLGANLSGIANLTGQVMNIASQIASQNYVGAIVSIVSGIADMIAGFQKANAEVAKLRKDFAESNPFLNPEDYQKAFTRSRGFFGDLFGGGPEVVNEIDAIGLKFAQSMAGAFSDGLSRGLRAWMDSGDVNDFRKTLYGSVFDATFTGLVDSFKTEVLKDILAPAMKMWTDALKTPGQDDDAAAINAVRDAAKAAVAAGEAWGAQILPLLDDMRSSMGLDTGGTGSGGLNGNLFGNAPSVQLGIPRIEVTIPGWDMQAIQTWNATMPVWERSVAKFEALLDRALGRGGVLPTTGVGGLAF